MSGLPSFLEDVLAPLADALAEAATSSSSSQRSQRAKSGGNCGTSRLSRVNVGGGDADEDGNLSDSGSSTVSDGRVGSRILDNEEGEEEEDGGTVSCDDSQPLAAPASASGGVRVSAVSMAGASAGQQHRYSTAAGAGLAVRGSLGSASGVPMEGDVGSPAAGGTPNSRSAKKESYAEVAAKDAIRWVGSAQVLCRCWPCPGTYWTQSSSGGDMSSNDLVGPERGGASPRLCASPGLCPYTMVGVCFRVPTCLLHAHHAPASPRSCATG